MNIELTYEDKNFENNKPSKDCSQLNNENSENTIENDTENHKDNDCENNGQSNDSNDKMHIKVDMYIPSKNDLMSYYEKKYQVKISIDDNDSELYDDTNTDRNLLYDEMMR